MKNKLLLTYFIIFIVAKAMAVNNPQVETVADLSGIIGSLSDNNVGYHSKYLKMLRFNDVESQGEGKYLITTRFGKLTLITMENDPYNPDPNRKDTLFYEQQKINIYDKNFPGYGVMTRWLVDFGDKITLILYDSECGSLLNCERIKNESIRFLTINKNHTYKLSKPYFMPKYPYTDSITVRNGKIYIKYIDWAIWWLDVNNTGDEYDNPESKYLGEYMYDPATNQVGQTKQNKTLNDYANLYRNKTAKSVLTDCEKLMVVKKSGDTYTWVDGDSCINMMPFTKCCFEYKAIESVALQDKFYQELHKGCGTLKIGDKNDKKTPYQLSDGVNDCHAHYRYFN